MSAGSWAVSFAGARGTVTIGADGIRFKTRAGAADENANVSADDLRAQEGKVGFLFTGSRTRQLRVTRPDGSVARFDGFKRDDVAGISEYLKSTFTCNVEKMQPAASGKSWGDLDVTEDSVAVYIGDQLSLEVPFANISQANTRGGDRVDLQLDDTAPENPREEQLTQIQFFVPYDHSAEYTGSSSITDKAELDQLSTGAGRLRNRIVDAAGIKSVTGEKILQLPPEVGTFMAPRGKFALELYQSYFRMYGTQYDNKIRYEDIVSFFLLDNPNNIEKAFVISLKETKKLRMGNQHYQHLVMNCKSNKNINVNILHSPEKIIEMLGPNDNGGAKLEQEYANVPLPKTVATLFRTISKKKVFVAGGTKGFNSHRGDSAVRCTVKSSSGLLFPTAKTLVFIHKPTMFIRYEDIAHIEFQRYDGANGRAHTFDLNVSCRSIGGEAPHEYTFKSISKNEYTYLLAYLHSNKGVDVHNLIQEQSKGRGRSKRAMYAQDADAAFAALGSESEGDGDSDADSDFNMSEAEDNQSSSSGSEYDSDGSDSDSSKKKRKRGKKNDRKTAKPAKKQKKMPKGDPDAPKKPLSSFMLFGNEMRNKIKEENPNLSFGEVGKVLGQKWKALGSEEKARFDGLAAKAKEDYNIEYEAYMQSEERKQWEGKMMAEFGTIPGTKAKKTKSKKEAKQKAPKKARSAFMFFVQAERPRIKEANQTASFGQMAGIMSKAWSTLTDEEKAPYNEKARADKVRATEEMAAWKKKIKEEKEARGEVSSMSEDTSSSSDSASGSDSDDNFDAEAASSSAAATK